MHANALAGLVLHWIQQCRLFGAGDKQTVIYKLELVASLLALDFWADKMKNGLQVCHESQLSSMAKLVIANEVRIRGLGGGRLQTDAFHAFPHLIKVASVVDFAAYVPGGNWVTVGFDPPLVRPVKCIWGEWNGG